MVRASDDEELEPTGWAPALAKVTDALKGADPRRVAVIGGSRLTNESQYAWAKLAKGVIGTDHVDAQLGDGLPAEVVLGLPRATIDDACRPGGTIILVGPDPKEALGALFLRLRHAVVNDGATLIELTPHRTGLSSIASHSLHPRPGEVGQLASALVAAGSATASDTAGVAGADIAAAAASIGGPVTVILGRASIAESADSVVDAAAALNGLSNVSFLSALVRGNVHGALDAGLAPGLLPGRSTVETSGARFAEAWGSVPDFVGHDTAGILAAAGSGEIDVLVLLGADPVNDHPSFAAATLGITMATTVIAVDTLMNDSAMAMADVVLPAAAATELDGTFTNLEGRVSICEQKVTPPGTARADWMIAAEISRRLGVDLGFESAEEIRAEAATVGTVSGPDESALAAGRVDGVLVSGNGDIAAPTAPATPVANDAYSLRLVATRRMYDDGVALRNSPSSSGLARPVELRLNPVDFAKVGVDAGTFVTLVSGDGEILVPVYEDAGVPAGSAAIPANAPGSGANELIDGFAPVTDVRVERA